MSPVHYKSQIIIQAGCVFSFSPWNFLPAFAFLPLTPLTDLVSESPSRAPFFQLPSSSRSFIRPGPNRQTNRAQSRNHGAPQPTGGSSCSNKPSPIRLLLHFLLKPILNSRTDDKVKKIGLQKSGLVYIPKPAFPRQ